MARTDHYRGADRWCVMCRKPIPAERKSDAVTCSPECTQARRNFGRSRKDQTECRYCFRPSTPEERGRYKVWRKFEQEMADNPQVAARVRAKWEHKAMEDPQLAGKVLDRALEGEITRLKRRVAELEPGTVPSDENPHHTEA